MKTPDLARRMLETLYKYSNELIELAMAEQPIPADLIRRVLRSATLHLEVQPVLCGAALQGIGVQPVLDAVGHYLPSPIRLSRRWKEPIRKTRERALRREPDPDEPFCGLVFKILPAKTGDLYWVRVYSGILKANSRVLNPRAEQEGKYCAVVADSCDQEGTGWAGRSCLDR